MSVQNTSTESNVANASGTSALMAVNGLNYGANDSSMSVVSSRKYKSFCALSTTHSPGDCMQFVLSSGAEYCNARNSYIQFEMNVTYNADTQAYQKASFGGGKSAINLFSEAVFTHSSGAEIDRTRDLNLLVNHKKKWAKGGDYFKSIATAYGHDNGTTGQARSNTSVTPYLPGEIPTSSPQTFILPLSDFSDIFDQNGQLLPNYLVAGSRLDLTLESAVTALVAGQGASGGAPTGTSSVTYTLTKAKIVLDLYTLVDSVVRQLSAISASSGLSIDFSGFWNVPTTTQAQNTCISVSKALSQANAVHVLIRNPAVLTDVEANLITDAFDTVPYDTALGGGDWQFVLGSQFMPQQPTGETVESYYQTQSAWLKLDQAAPNTIGLTEHYNKLVPTTQAAVYEKNDIISSMISLSLERNSLLTNSGQAVSAQRGLQVVLNFKDTTSYRINVFIDYVRLVDIFTDQITVRL